jgi:hypothetical protein
VGPSGRTQNPSQPSKQLDNTVRESSDKQKNIFFMAKYGFLDGAIQYIALSIKVALAKKRLLRNLKKYGAS